MSMGRDRGLFPQNLLRFLASCQRLGTPTAEAVKIYMASFRTEAQVYDGLGVIKKSLNLGTSLEDALDAQPDLVPGWIVQMMRWSATDSSRADTLDWAAGELDRQARSGRALQVALIYPITLITIGLVMALFTALMLGPQIRSISNAMGYDHGGFVPGFDQMFPTAGVLARRSLSLTDTPGLFIALLLIWGLGAVSLFWSRSRLHEPIREFLEGRLFGMGGLRQQQQESLLLGMVACGLRGGVPIDQICDVLGRTAPLASSRAFFWMATRQLQSGTSIAETFGCSGGSEAFGSALAVGLSSTDAPDVLGRMAESSRAEVDHALDMRLRRLTPALSVFAMVLASIVPVAQILWLFRLTSALSTGDL